MMVMLLGKKIGMTRVYDESGKIAPVTVIQAGPCMVMQVKTNKSDGYSAIQLGYGDIKQSRVKKPAAGHANKANTPPKKFVRELRLDNSGEAEYTVGDEISVSAFSLRTVPSESTERRVLFQVTPATPVTVVIRKKVKRWQGIWALYELRRSITALFL